MYVFELCDKLGITVEEAKVALARMQARGEIQGFNPNEPNDEYADIILTGRTRAAMILNGENDE